MGHRRLLTAILLILSINLYAGAWYLEGGLGYRDSVTTQMPLTVNLAGGIDDFDFDLRFQSLEHFDLSAGYRLNASDMIFFDFILHTHYAYREGGFSDAAALFNLSFDIFKWLNIEGSLGVQAGAAYSPYSRDIMWSLSPLVALKSTFIIGPVDASGYITFISEDERNWKAVPVFGGELLWNIDSNNAIRLSGWMKSAEYLIDKWTLITAYGAKVTYVYRGGAI